MAKFDINEYFAQVLRLQGPRRFMLSMLKDESEIDRMIDLLVNINDGDVGNIIYLCMKNDNLSADSSVSSTPGFHKAFCQLCAKILKGKLNILSYDDTKLKFSQNYIKAYFLKDDVIKIPRTVLTTHVFEIFPDWKAKMDSYQGFEKWLRNQINQYDTVSNYFSIMLCLTEN